MATQTYTVASEQPIQVYPAGQQASLLLRNNDSMNHVFLATVPSGVGFDLGPGSAIEWEAGNALFASVKLNKPVSITILDNGGALFDASAIAAQISISGAPPIDVPVTLYNGDVNQQGVVRYNISAYQSLFLNMLGSAFSADIIAMKVAFFTDDLTLTPMNTSVFQTYGNGGEIFAAVPITASYVEVSGFLAGGSIIVDNKATFRILASYRVTSKPVCKLYPGGIQGSSALITVVNPIWRTGDDNYTGWTWTTLNASQSRVDYPSFKAGNVYINVRLNAPVTAGVVIVTIQDSEFPTVALASATIGVGGQQTSFNLNAPYRQFNVAVSTNAAFAPVGNSVFVSVVGSDS